MNKVWRALIEVGFIMFLFYSNLLMGEFGRSGIRNNLVRISTGIEAVEDIIADLDQALRV